MRMVQSATKISKCQKYVPTHDPNVETFSCLTLVADCIINKDATLIVMAATFVFVNSYYKYSTLFDLIEVTCIQNIRSYYTTS